MLSKALEADFKIQNVEVVMGNKVVKGSVLAEIIQAIISIEPAEEAPSIRIVGEGDAVVGSIEDHEFSKKVCTLFYQAVDEFAEHESKIKAKEASLEASRKVGAELPGEMRVTAEERLARNKLAKKREILQAFFWLSVYDALGTACFPTGENRDLALCKGWEIVDIIDEDTDEGISESIELIVGLSGIPRNILKKIRMGEVVTAEEFEEAVKNGAKPDGECDCPNCQGLRAAQERLAKKEEADG